MPAYYFDTSAMAKRYVVEVGSAWVQAIVTQQSGQTIADPKKKNQNYAWVGQTSANNKAMVEIFNGVNESR